MFSVSFDREFVFIHLFGVPGRIACDLVRLCAAGDVRGLYPPACPGNWVDDDALPVEHVYRRPSHCRACAADDGVDDGACFFRLRESDISPGELFPAQFGCPLPFVGPNTPSSDHPRHDPQSTCPALCPS